MDLIKTKAILEVMGAIMILSNATIFKFGIPRKEEPLSF